MTGPWFRETATEKMHETESEKDEALERNLDTFESSWVRKMRELHQAYPELHSPRSLDQYFHQELEGKQLQEDNSQQVLSRFISHRTVIHRQVRLKFQEEELNAKRNSWYQSSYGNEGSGKASNTWATIWDRMRKNWFTSESLRNDSIVFDTLPAVEHQTSGKGPPETRGTEENRADMHDNKLPRQQLLVVPQLWLWKLDSVSQKPYSQNSTRSGVYCGASLYVQLTWPLKLYRHRRHFFP